MAEYTYADIIMDPNDPRLEGAIGKECYFADYPKLLLEDARSNSSIICSYRLREICKNAKYSFVDKDGHTWTLIIIKKEEPKPKPKYIPFENVTEFLDAYRRVERLRLKDENFYLSVRGIWLKGKASKAYYMVIKIWDIGVFIIGDLNGTTWEELLEYYTFLDGSPCGKEVKE